MALIDIGLKLNLRSKASSDYPLVSNFSWEKFKKAVRDFNSMMNARVEQTNTLGIYTSTYISKEGWPEVARKSR